MPSTHSAPPAPTPGRIGRVLSFRRTLAARAMVAGAVVRTEAGDRPLTDPERERYLADAAAWRAARTLPELGELTAAWLTGANSYQPGYAATGPDRETAELLDVLAAVNRRGLVTISSQPGHAAARGVDGWLWTQHAAVTGFASEATARSITGYLNVRGYGLNLRTWRPAAGGRARFSRSHAIEATVREHPESGEEQVITVFGTFIPAGSLRALYGRELGRHGVAAVLGAWQITLAEFDHGPEEHNTRLWPMLAAWAEAEGSRP